MEEFSKIFVACLPDNSPDDVRRSFIISIIDAFQNRASADGIEISDDVYQNMVDNCLKSISFEKPVIARKKVPVKAEPFEGEKPEDPYSPFTLVEGQCTKKFVRGPNKDHYCGKAAEEGSTVCKTHRRSVKEKATTSSVKPRTAPIGGVNPAVGKRTTPQKGASTPIGLNVNRAAQVTLSIKPYGNPGDFIFLEATYKYLIHRPNGNHSEGGVFAKLNKVGDKESIQPLLPHDRKKLEELKLNIIDYDYDHLIPSNGSVKKPPPTPTDYEEDSQDDVQDDVQDAEDDAEDAEDDSQNDAEDDSQSEAKNVPQPAPSFRRPVATTKIQPPKIVKKEPKETPKENPFEAPAEPDVDQEESQEEPPVEEPKQEVKKPSLRTATAPRPGITATRPSAGGPRRTTAKVVPTE